ncbi:MAG: cystathionine beta-lyase, partial [Rhodospirillales bacterium]|nr:cystathionine beta-lyase [Rhodospirillales bacterium]
MVKKKANRRKDTNLTLSGRSPEDNHGIVNPPVYHASTVTFPTLAAMEDAAKHPLDGVYYGRYGTPTSFAFEEAVADLEGGDRCLSVGSGLAAIAVSLLAFLKKGDHLLMVDSVYFPTRKLCDGYLAGFGVETTYYDPMIGENIASLMRPETKVVFVEAPGSLTFEVQDIPAIARAAHAGGALVIMDNTWSAGYYFQPFERGVDVSVQAATKYIVGHSDAMLGTVTTSNELYEKIKWTAIGFGYCAGPDDCYLGLRGLRSLSARLARHQESGLELARWLASRPEVTRILHPALPECPGHDVWKRDFTGASGLFAVELKPATRDALAAMLDGLELFGMGYSWGGFESLIIPSDPTKIRTATEWKADGPLV